MHRITGSRLHTCKRLRYMKANGVTGLTSKLDVAGLGDKSYDEKKILTILITQIK